MSHNRKRIFTTQGKEMNGVLFEIKIDKASSLVIPDLTKTSEIFYIIDKDRDHLRTWLPWVDSIITEADVRKNLIERIEGFRQNKQASFFGIFQGKFVASVGFNKLDNGIGEIGYWLLSSYNGRGLMTSFVQRCLEYGFDELNLETIVIKCAEKNLKSIAVPNRLNFVQTGKSSEKRIRNGSEQHTLIFTLNKNDWSK